MSFREPLGEQVGHPLSQWREEVASLAVTVGYWEWVRDREDAAEILGRAYCRTCGDIYEDCGDGYDGECPSCADKTEQERLKGHPPRRRETFTLKVVVEAEEDANIYGLLKSHLVTSFDGDFDAEIIDIEIE